MRKRTGRNFVSKYLLNHLVAKLMALALALVLWLYAYNGSLARDKSFSVPVQVKSEEGWSLGEVRPRRIEVQLNCPRRFEARVEQALRTATIECAASPENQKSDKQTVSVSLEPSNLRLAPAIRNLISSLRFKPAKLEVQLTREISRALEVRLKLSEPPAGYEVSDSIRTPQKVRVRGPKDVVSRAKFIETEEINISVPPLPYEKVCRHEGVAALVTHVLVAEVEQAITLESNSRVGYHVVLTQKLASKDFSDIPIHLHVPPDYPFVAQLEEEVGGENQWRTTVTVSGRADLVDQLKPEDIDLYIKVGELQPNEALYNVPIQNNIVGARFMELVVTKLGITTCKVKVSEPAAEPAEGTL